MPTVTFDQLGSFVVVLIALTGFAATIVGLLLGIARLRQIPPAKLQPVTREEAALFATKVELVEVKDTIDKLQTYLQNRLHELANQLAPLPVQVNLLIKQQERLELKLDLNAGRQEKLLALFSAKSEDGGKPDV